MKKIIDFLKIKFMPEEYTMCYCCKRVIKRNYKSDSAIWGWKQLCTPCDDSRFL